MSENTRAHYRLRYPAPERPVFVAGDHGPHDVVDCSERGFRFVPPQPGAPLPEIGALALGEIRFRSGQVVPVAGVVVRVQDREVAVRLDHTEIPFGVVMHEQLRVRRRYPFFDRDRAAA